MKYLRISENSTSMELESIARAIHQVVRLPVVVTSLNGTEDRIEIGKYRSHP